MAKNRKNNKAGGSPISLVGLLILLVVLFILWQRFKTSETADPGFSADTAVAISPASVEDEKENASIEHVVILSDVKEEIIRYPGFTVSFNSEFKQPNYVVWELTRDEVKSRVVKRRNDTFASDPNVVGCADLEDYLGSHYDRGHMAPAADMKWSQEAMDACFLLTNMSPQKHALNSRAWNTLEEQCRDWAVRDSAIVIVCGPILSDVITKYIGKNRVAVPERFFKVVLAPYARPPRAIGFIMPNRNVTGGLQSTSVSVDEIEQITGFDFFSALPDGIEDRVESENNYPRWTHR